MPSVNLSPETYEKLKEFASRKGRDPDEIAQNAVVRLLREAEMTHEEWTRQFEEAVTELRAGIPPELTPEEIQAEIDLAIKEVRAERRARRN